MTFEGVKWRWDYSRFVDTWNGRRESGQLKRASYTPCQSYRVSLAIWDHTVLPATRHKWTRPALTPASQAGTRFIYPGGIEGCRLSWCWWLGDSNKQEAYSCRLDGRDEPPKMPVALLPWLFQKRKFRRFVIFCCVLWLNGTSISNSVWRSDEVPSYTDSEHIYHSLVAFFDLTSCFLLFIISSTVFTHNVCEIKWPFMCRFAVKKLLTHNA